MKLKLVSCLLILGMLVSSFTAGSNQHISLSVLNELERVLYGDAREGALLSRVEDLEMEIFGSPQSGQ